MEWYKIIIVGPGIAVAVMLAPLVAGDEFRHSADIPHVEVPSYPVPTTAGPTISSSGSSGLFRTLSGSQPASTGAISAVINA